MMMRAWLLILLTGIAYAKPICIPHHAGENDWPSNTIYAIKAANQSGFDTLNLTLELSRDQIPFTYHGFQLQQFSNGSGDPESYTMSQLEQLDAAYLFGKDKNYPLRGKNITIATLTDILNATHSTLILDLKSHHNDQLVRRVVDTINQSAEAGWNWQRTVFYSTDQATLQNLKSLQPKAQIFVDRLSTFNLLLTGTITPAMAKQIKNSSWIGFELDRDIQVCEQFTLGQQCVNIKKRMWDKDIIDKIKAINPHIHIVLFAIDSPESYNKAKQLNVDGVYTNSPLEICVH